MLEALKTLSDLPGPSGFIGPVAEKAKKLLDPFVDESYIDRMGNVVGFRSCGKVGAGRLLLDAHLDEIGFIVTGHEDGFLTFAPIGGVDPRMLPAQELTILTQPYRYGVVAVKPPHIMSDEEQEKALKIEELRVDTGLTQEDAKKLIPVGTPMVYNQKCFSLNGTRICGKALDDRSCFVMILRALEILREVTLSVDIVIVGSNLEERGCDAAAAASFALQPDFAVVADVTFGAQPEVRKEESFDLGAGPIVGVGPNMSRWMTKKILDTADRCGISCAKEVMSGNSGTNAWKIQTSREGIATQVISLPLRYMHTPGEVVDLNDLEAAAQLLAAFILDFGKEVPVC